MQMSTKLNQIYGPKPSKYKKQLREAKVTLGAVSNYLNLNYSYTSHLLNGTYRLTPEIEYRLQALIREAKDS